MLVSVLYFGILKDAMSGDGGAVALGEGATVAALMAGLPKPELPVWKSVAVAVNREYAGLATVLHEGDEVAFLPPVSGGCDAR